MCEVRLTKRFKKQFRKLDKPIQRKIIKTLEILEKNPQYGEPLKGILSDLRKIRVHDYRVVFKLYSSNTIAEVFFVDHRRRVYRELKRLRREEVI